MLPWTFNYAIKICKIVNDHSFKTRAFFLLWQGPFIDYFPSRKLIKIIENSIFIQILPFCNNTVLFCPRAVSPTSEKSPESRTSRLPET
jgi:hypothetical protein